MTLTPENVYCLLAGQVSGHGTPSTLCHKLILSEYTTCPQNAHCDGPSWSCECDDPMFIFLESSHKCEPAKLFGEDCEVSFWSDFEPCYKSGGLKCKNRKCECSKSHFIWNNASDCIDASCHRRTAGAFQVEETQECKRQLGYSYNMKTLSTYQQQLISCPENAAFRSSPTGKSETEPRSYVSCFCDEGYVENSDLTACLLAIGYNQTCKKGDPCNSAIGLSCDETDLVCKCRPDGRWSQDEELCFSDLDCYERHPWSIVNEDLSACEILVDRMCDPDQSDVKCTANSTCVDIKSNPYYPETRCKCDANFTRSKDVSCLAIKHWGDDCDASNGDPCSAESKLTCLPDAGKCGCKENEVWESLNNACALGVGKKCTQEQDCIRNAECELLVYYKYCRCKPGYMEYDGRCLGLDLAKCEVNEECSNHIGLTCIDGLCKCTNVDQQYFDKGLQKCVNLIGRPCKKDTKERNCPQNSICGDNEVCECESGYQETPNRRCAKMLKYGQSCSTGECNFLKGLACISSKCSCFLPSLKFDTDLGCTAPVGENCGALESMGACLKDDRSDPCEYYMAGCETSAQCTAVGNGISKCMEIVAPTQH